MTDFERIIASFNANAKCRRRKDAKPQASYEPGVLSIGCDHPSCACRMNLHGDERPTLTEVLKMWEDWHG